MRNRRPAVAIVLLLVIVLSLNGCASGPVGQGAARGGAVGAFLGAVGGYLFGGEKGAVLGAGIGAAIGAATGAIVGSSEVAVANLAPHPLPWLIVPEGSPKKRVTISFTSSFGYFGSDPVSAVVEEQMMLRGAAVYKRPAGNVRAQSDSVDYVVVVSAYEQAGAVTVTLQVIDPSTRIIANATSGPRFTSAGSGFYSVGDARIDALRVAAKQAVWSLK